MEQDNRSVTTNHISGTIHGPTVQVGSVHGDVYIHGAPDSAARAVAVAPPQGWTDLPQLPDEIEFLLRAQVQVAQKMPYRLPGARRPSLATVYVRQDLGTEEPSAEQPRPTPIVDSRGQLKDPPSVPVVRSVVRPPSRTVRDALDSDDHMLVTGGPGQGKSTLSLRLAADVAGQWFSGGEDAPIAEPVVPLRLPARELAARVSLPFTSAVAESTQVEYGALLGSALDSRVFGERIVGCRWLMLVDGLDEVADVDVRDRLVTVLAAWASRAESPYRIVLTTRPIEGAALAPLQRIGAARYELQPFDEEALRHFATNWFEDADHGSRFVRQIRAAHLDELVRVPLLATIAAIIFEQHGGRPLPDNQYELYESYLRYLRSAHAVADSRFDHACGPLLEHLGLVRLEIDTSLVAAAQEWAEQHLPGLTGDWADELETYLAAVGPFTRRGNDLRFLHHSFAEHLAATAKARKLPERFEPEHAYFARLLHAARPDEGGRHARAVLLHYTRLRTAEADRLVGWLHKADVDQHLLAARLLAWHTPAGPAVVESFLTTVRAWAMTTQYRAQQILEQASRAAHHPGIVDWLLDLMRDEDAPWESRVEAATALSTRLRGAWSFDAVALLRLVVADTAIPVADRLAAAEALSDCGGEREASERGLRSVLADPAASARNCRNAAVVLAGFGGAAREHAVGALTAMLDDPWTPDDDLVEAASGLVEIGAEFHERCAEVFRSVLGSRATNLNGFHDAAIGLASLGHHQANEAVAALTRLVTDRRLELFVRTNAAAWLAELGPQHRVAAGAHLLAMSTEFDVDAGDRQRLAASLATNGFHDQALNLVRVLFTDRTATPNSRLWAARTLAELGPEYRGEAAHALLRVAHHPGASDYDRAAALAELAALGEPHRTSAVSELRGVLGDRGAEPAFRCEVASELANLGPEFHGEVAEHLLEIASCQVDPDVRAGAWSTLRRIGPEFRDRASAALLVLAGPDEAATWESHRSSWAPSQSDIDDRDVLVHVLLAILNDPTRAGRARIGAASTLINLGKRFHQFTVDSLIGQLRSGALYVGDLLGIVLRSGELGSVSRAEFAETLRVVARDPNATATTVCMVAESLRRLGYWADTEIIALLRGIVTDDLADSDVRREAAVAIARVAMDEHVVEVVLGNDSSRSAYVWQRRVREIAALGADVVPGLRALLSDVNLRRRIREASAAALARVRPDLCAEALAELRAQAADEFLEFQWRTDVVLALAEADPSTLGDAVAYHEAVLADERVAVADRCEAARRLGQLDESWCEAAFAALRRFATSSEFTAEEHERGVYWLSRLRPYDSAEAIRLGSAVAADPTASVRSRVSLELAGKARLEVERSLLADSMAAPIERVGGLTMWQWPGLAAEAEAVLRDVITAVETLPAERVEAAAALAGLSPRHVPEAVRVLEELSTDWRVGYDARIKLAELGQARRRRIAAEAMAIVSDESRPWRQRSDAAVLIFDLTSTPPEPVVQYVRQLAHNQRVSDRERAMMLYALRELDQLRSIRDDARTAASIRWTVADRLRSYDVADRAAGAQVLDAIATDTTCRPTLRWRAAQDLTRFGARGRALGVAALQAIAADETLPVTVRADAASVLSKVRPDLRLEMLRLLRGLATEKPLARIKVLTAIGQSDASEGALALRDMALDRTLTPGVRLRAAAAMAQLRRDYRDKAAVVAKDVAYDVTALRHVRVKATRALARWSEPCRAEARSLLVELVDPRGRNRSTR